MSKHYAVAKMTCRDGKTRTFTAQESDDCVVYKSSKYNYTIWDEIEGRGFRTMSYSKKAGETDFKEAAKGFQPVKIEMVTSDGSWIWQELEGVSK